MEKKAYKKLWTRLEQFLKSDDEYGNITTEVIRTGFRYNADGQRYLTIDGEGKVTVKTYDPLGRVNRILYFGEYNADTIDLENYDYYPCYSPCYIIAIFCREALRILRR